MAPKLARSVRHLQAESRLPTQCRIGSTNAAATGAWRCEIAAVTRLRDLELAIGSLSAGPLHAIADVAGVRVGHRTIVRGEGPLVVGESPVRTGVTVVLPRAGSAREQALFAGAFTLNGNGEFTGLEWIHESGMLASPIGLTNTHGVGVVRDALAEYDYESFGAGAPYWSLPTVAETFDSVLNDINGHHVTRSHVFEALEVATAGPVLEGSVGGGTGMTCHGFKGGIGTSSRVLQPDDGGWTVGVLAQANYGRRQDLRVAGVDVGARIPEAEVPIPRATRPLPRGAGSIIVIVATDAPLMPDQCQRLATRAAVGLARVRCGASDSSGDIMFAFSTANTGIGPRPTTARRPLCTS